VGPRAGLDGCGKSCSYWDSIPDRPTRDESLYRLHCAGSKCVPEQGKSSNIQVNEIDVKWDRRPLVQRVRHIVHTGG
jgi:hypothetical protein